MLEEQWSEIFWGNEREDGTHTKILGTIGWSTSSVVVSNTYNPSLPESSISIYNNGSPVLMW